MAMTELAVIFTTYSDIEASVVQALLQSHGLEVMRLSGPPPGVFAFAVSPLGEFRVAVRTADAEDARRIIDSHRERIGTGLVVPLPQQFADAEARLGYRFKDRGLLEHALTHKSRTAEDPSGGVVDNESLEFLGDAVLGFVIAEVLYREFPDFSEGQKSKVKAAVVSTTALAGVSERLGLGGDLILGRGEEKTGGRGKPALLADVFEAVIAAVYLDGGVDQARTFVLRHLGPLVAEARQPEYFGRDYKSRLQERLQASGRPLPQYRLVGETGPDHRKRFEIEVFVSGELLARGSGRTKKEAEQVAAGLALEALDVRERGQP
jgi:ribonuclease-3